MEENTISEEWKPKVNPWLMAVPLLTSAFMAVLDGTAANVALPHMAGSFSVSKEESMWILTSYLIASGIIIPSVDFFCKLFGRKNFFMICVITFTLASFFCGLAKSIEVMLLARIIQGLGGGALTPIAQTIMIEGFTPEKRGKSIALFGIVLSAAPVIGPIVGGWITDNWAWPYIFFINIPIGILSLILTKMYVEDPPYLKKQSNIKIDKWGFFYLIGWLVSFQIVMDKGNNADWFGSTWICWTFLASIVFFILFISSQLIQKNSLCDLSIFKDRNFFFGSFLQMGMQGLLMGSMAILPTFLQGLLGYTAFLSGVAYMTRGLGCIISLFLYGIISRKINDKVAIIIGLILISISCWQLGSLNLQIAAVSISIPNLIFGIGLGFAIVPIIPMTCSTLKNSQMTNASGLQNLMKNVGGAIGTSAVTTAVSRLSQSHQHSLVGNLNPLNPNYAERLHAYSSMLAGHTDATSALIMAKKIMYNQLLQQSTLFAYMDTFKIFTIVSLLIIPMLFFMKSKKIST